MTERAWTVTLHYRNGTKTTNTVVAPTGDAAVSEAVRINGLTPVWADVKIIQYDA